MTVHKPFDENWTSRSPNLQTHTQHSLTHIYLKSIYKYKISLWRYLYVVNKYMLNCCIFFVCSFNCTHALHPITPQTHNPLQTGNGCPVS
jgi:hypothetical protein